jgi:hypothetical protein
MFCGMEQTAPRANKESDKWKDVNPKHIDAGSHLMAQPLSGTMSDMCNGCLMPQCEGIDALGIIPHGNGHVFESAWG